MMIPPYHTEFDYFSFSRAFPAETADLPAGIYSEMLLFRLPQFPEFRTGRAAPKAETHHPANIAVDCSRSPDLKEPHIELAVGRRSVEFWLLPATVIELKVSACRAFLVPSCLGQLRGRLDWQQT